MERHIKNRLADIERDEDVLVCLAVESGSRAWGFPSADSDYDVRFIYVRRPEWYLSIDLERRSDVIERPIEDVIDLCGWDIRKALRLFRKSNPPLLEWLQYETVYVEKLMFARHLREMIPEFHSPKASYHHYRNMAEGSFRKLVSGEDAQLKQCFYVLRGLLAVRWVRAGLGVVPGEFRRLLYETITDAVLREAIEALLEAKSAGGELDARRLPDSIERFIEGEMDGGPAMTDLDGSATTEVARLDSLFRATLAEAWPGRSVV